MTEAKRFEVPVDDSPMGTVTVIEEPSRAEFQRFLRRSEQQELRGILGHTLVVWDAALAIHSDMDALERGDALVLRADQIEVGSPEEDTEEEEAEQQVEFVKYHRSIIRLYGPDPPVVSRFML